VPRVWEEGAGGRLDQVEGAERVNGVGAAPARLARISGEQPSIPGKERRRVASASKEPRLSREVENQHLAGAIAGLVNCPATVPASAKLWRPPPPDSPAIWRVHSPRTGAALCESTAAGVAQYFTRPEVMALPTL
jgi:hypothetical protein